MFHLFKGVAVLPDVTIIGRSASKVKYIFSKFENKTLLSEVKNRIPEMFDENTKSVITSENYNPEKESVKIFNSMSVKIFNSILDVVGPSKKWKNFEIFFEELFDIPTVDLPLSFSKKSRKTQIEILCDKESFIHMFCSYTKLTKKNISVNTAYNIYITSISKLFPISSESINVMDFFLSKEDFEDIFKIYKKLKPSQEFINKIAPYLPVEFQLATYWINGIESNQIKEMRDNYIENISKTLSSRLNDLNTSIKIFLLSQRNDTKSISELPNFIGSLNDIKLSDVNCLYNKIEEYDNISPFFINIGDNLFLKSIYQFFDKIKSEWIKNNTSFKNILSDIIKYSYSDKTYVPILFLGIESSSSKNKIEECLSCTNQILLFYIFDLIRSDKKTILSEMLIS